jgi:hypothetical protein
VDEQALADALRRKAVERAGEFSWKRHVEALVGALGVA